MDAPTADTPVGQPTGRERSLQNLQRGRKPWKPGESGNPAGRPLGARTKITEKFLMELQKLWLKRGAKILEKAASEDASAFVAMIARLLPAKVDLDLYASQSGPARTLEQVQGDISAAIEARARELAQQMHDQALTVVTVPQAAEQPHRSVDNSGNGLCISQIIDESQQGQ